MLNTSTHVSCVIIAGQASWVRKLLLDRVVQRGRGAGAGLRLQASLRSLQGLCSNISLWSLCQHVCFVRRRAHGLVEQVTFTTPPGSWCLSPWSRSPSLTRAATGARSHTRTRWAAGSPTPASWRTWPTWWCSGRPTSWGSASTTGPRLETGRVSGLWPRGRASRLGEWCSLLSF